MSTILERLKVFDTDRCNIDQAIELLAQARVLCSGYGEAGLPFPEEAADATEGLKAFIAAKRKDELARTLKKLEAEAAGDMSAEERRNARAARIAQVKTELGK